MKKKPIPEGIPAPPGRRLEGNPEALDPEDLANQNWVLAALIPLAHKSGCPGTSGTSGSSTSRVRAILRIIADQGGVHKYEVVDYGPEKGIGPKVDPVIPVEVTLQQLVDLIEDTCVSFPATIEIRKMYEGLGHTPADGRRADDIRVKEGWKS